MHTAENLFAHCERYLALFCFDVGHSSHLPVQLILAGWQGWCSGKQHLRCRLQAWLECLDDFAIAFDDKDRANVIDRPVEAHRERSTATVNRGICCRDGFQEGLRPGVGSTYRSSAQLRLSLQSFSTAVTSTICRRRPALLRCSPEDGGSSRGP